jgi:glycosyltransferase involved in cell wall biosynthesis
MINQVPLISVVIPTFNRLAQTIQAAKSVRSQTYANVEIIVVDDGSDRICREQLTRSLQPLGCRTIFHQKNKGACTARNTGIHHAQGDYVSFLDSDDIWFEQKLEIQMEAMLSAPEPLSVVTCGARCVADHGHFLRNFLPPPVVVQKDLLRSNVVGSCSNTLLPRDLLERIGGFDERLSACQDWDLWLRCAQIDKIIGVQAFLIEYYDGPGGRISNNPVGRLKGHLDFFRKHAGLYREADKDILACRDLKLAKLLLTNQKLASAQCRFASSASLSAGTGDLGICSAAMGGLILSRIPTQTRVNLIASFKNLSHSVRKLKSQIL